jgi:general secretion pathway protein L
MVSSDKGFAIYRKSRVDFDLDDRNMQSDWRGLDETVSSENIGNSVVLSLDRQFCFVHSFEIPLQAAPKIEALVRLEIARITPFSLEQVYHGWHFREPDHVSRFCNVTLYVIRKAYIAEIYQALSKSGVEVIAIIVRDQGKAAARFALAQDGTRFGQPVMKKWRQAVAASGVVLCVCLGVLLASIWSVQSKSSAMIEEKVAKYGLAAVSVRKQLDVLAQNNSTLAALMKKKNDTSSRSAIIEEVSKLIPDDTYLDTLGISSDTMAFEGASVNPERLISILEASALFKNVVFTSPSFRNPGETKSRFSIKLDLEAGNVAK